MSTTWSRFNTALRGRWRLAASVLGAAVAGTLCATLLTPPRYTATAEVLVDPRDGTGARAPLSPGFVATQVDLVTSRKVALMVVDALRLVDEPVATRRWRESTGVVGSARHVHADLLSERLEVRPSRDSGLIWIRYTASEPAFAAAVATAFARAYVETVALIDADAARAPHDVDRLATHADPAAPSAGRRGGYAEAMLLTPAGEPPRPSSPQLAANLAMAAALGAILAAASVMVAEARRRRIRSPDDLEAATAAPVMGMLSDRSTMPRAGRGGSLAAALPGRMLAEGPLGRVPPKVAADGIETRSLAPGAVPVDRKRPLGAIMVEAGMIQEPAVERILAWARQEGVRFGEAAVQSQFATEAQVRRALAVQFDFPVLDPKGSVVSPELVAAFDSGSPVVADLRRLRSHLHARLTERAQRDGPRTAQAIAVVSPGRGEGRTFVATNLAVSFSQVGRRTLLIDADLAGGRIHALLGIDNQTGLSAMLNGRILPGALRRVPGLPELTVITSGGAAPNATDLLSREAFEHLLTSFRRAYDVVIIDTPAADDEPDAEVIARRAGACVIVAREGVTDFAAVRALSRSLAALEVTVLGSTLVRA